MEKIFSIRKHPLAFTALSFAVLLLLGFAVTSINTDIRREASEPVISEVDLNVGGVVIVYCRAETLLVNPSDISGVNEASFVCLGETIDVDDPDVRDTGADRFFIMYPDEVVTLKCPGSFEQFTLKQDRGYQIFCN